MKFYKIINLEPTYLFYRRQCLVKTMDILGNVWIFNIFIIDIFSYRKQVILERYHSFVYNTMFTVLCCQQERRRREAHSRARGDLGAPGGGGPWSWARGASLSCQHGRTVSNGDAKIVFCPGARTQIRIVRALLILTWECQVRAWLIMNRWLLKGYAEGLRADYRQNCWPWFYCRRAFSFDSGSAEPNQRHVTFLF